MNKSKKRLAVVYELSGVPKSNDYTMTIRNLNRDETLGFKKLVSKINRKRKSEYLHKMTYKITKETRKTFIPNRFFYSIPLKSATGGKLVVIASDLEEAKKLIDFELEIREVE